MERSHLWSKLANTVFMAKLPDNADAVFVHAFDTLLDDLLKEAAVLSGRFGDIPIVLNGATEYETGGRGVAYARSQLETYGVAPRLIVATPTALQTREEAEAFSEYAQEHSIKTVVILTLPPHVVRAYLTDLFSFQSRNLVTQLVPRTIPVHWDDEVTITGLISTLETTSFLGRVFSECARIMEYRQRYEGGDIAYSIATIQEGLDHSRGFCSK